MNTEDHRIEDDIFEAIRTGKAKMRPRWYFILQMILEIATALALVGILLFIANFILFIMHENGGLFAINFGIAGWYVFFRSLPWTLVLIGFLVLLLLIVLLRRYGFIYKRPLVYLLIGLVILMALSSFLLTATSFSSGLVNYAESNIPVIQNVYQFESTLPGDIHRGIVRSITSDGFVMEDPGGTMRPVIFGRTVDPMILKSLSIDDFILVFGAENASGTIEALGLEKIQ